MVCGICGELIHERQSWHLSYEGRNHAICEFNQRRARQGLPQLANLYSGELLAVMLPTVKPKKTTPKKVLT